VRMVSRQWGTPVVLTVIGLLVVGGWIWGMGKNVDAANKSADRSAADVTIVYHSLYAAEEVNDIARLTERSALVIEGHVDGVESLMRGASRPVSGTASEMVYQDFLVRIARVLKGSDRSEGDVVRVRVLGGTTDGLTVSMGDSAPRLAVGEDVLLFLSDTPTPECPSGQGFQYLVYADGFGSFTVRGGLAVRDADATQASASAGVSITELRDQVTAAAGAP